MSKLPSCKPLVRSLYPWEIEEARCVFANSLDYRCIRIHECVTWPNTLDKIGRWLKRMPVIETQNAITMGNHCFFPVNLQTQLVPVDDVEYYKLPWLIHELTHTWQYQHLGWRYLLQALGAQFRQKENAYNFGQAEGLKMHRREGWTLRKFNLEQQGDIARSYYERIRKGEDVTDWVPYIEDIQHQA